MNFSLTVKKELIAGAPRAKCCKRAYLHGLFFNTAGTRDHTLVLALSSADARHEVMRVYREMLHKEALMDGNRLLFSSGRLYEELTAPAEGADKNGGNRYGCCYHYQRKF